MGVLQFTKHFHAPNLLWPWQKAAVKENYPYSNAVNAKAQRA